MLFFIQIKVLTLTAKAKANFLQVGASAPLQFVAD